MSKLRIKCIVEPSLTFGRLIVFFLSKANKGTESLCPQFKDIYLFEVFGMILFR